MVMGGRRVLCSIGSCWSRAIGWQSFFLSRGWSPNLRKAYEKSFLYTEADDNDIGYFVAYNLRVLDLSFKQLQSYLLKKQKEKRAANAFLQSAGINERQAQLIQLFIDNPKEIITVKYVQSKFLVSPTTAKNDIIGLVERQLLCEFAFNKVKNGYRRSEHFEDALQTLQG